MTTAVVPTSGEAELTNLGVTKELVSTRMALTQEELNTINVPQSASENRQALERLGGAHGLAKALGVDPAVGLTADQLRRNVETYGTNHIPGKPMVPFWQLFLDALNDTTLWILMASATVSLIIGQLAHHGEAGWIEGVAIWIAVLVVGLISSSNDYQKELKFRALEKAAEADESISVMRGGERLRINPSELTVGDVLLLQAGDGIPADAVLVTEGVKIKADEASLTGESEPLTKTTNGDCFLLGASTVCDAAQEVRAVVFGVAGFSQWGRIRVNLSSSEDAATPLQHKLELMASRIGYVGSVFAVGVFIAIISYVLTGKKDVTVAEGVVEAFIIAITVVVVSIPEGLPLAVTISLAYSTGKMYKDQNLIRELSACETMGNATTICSDKTGTLTQNKMTVVECWTGDATYDNNERKFTEVSPALRALISEQASINRLATLQLHDQQGRLLPKPQVIGSATEGALMMMLEHWGLNYETVAKEGTYPGDMIFSFNSTKKRSSAVQHRPDGTVRIYCKGAPEWIMRDCTHFATPDGGKAELTATKRAELEQVLLGMAGRALRTLCLAHRDLSSASQLPAGWEDNGAPDNAHLVIDCIVGIIDPLRDDVIDAVKKAHRAGVIVRMVTGDNINTAKAIARQCGILTDGGISIEGPAFRNMTPKEVDAMLPRLQVVARSSPEDKFLLVTRLNGHGLPETKEEWEAKHPGYSWETDRDRLLPGYRQEWESTRPDGGAVVGVTGDGTNDAPALKAADVGLAMGITGTKVAKEASKIVILDDKFSSIVRAIMWGRSVYDNIRKFLQFQLTVNVVALTLVFVGSLAGFDPPLNAVMMLWVNLIMDTLGALALGTEMPGEVLLDRRPYKRNATLISRPMLRGILVQSAWQLALLFALLFKGADWFGVESNSTRHMTIIFNAFVTSQLSNEFNARRLDDRQDIFSGLLDNPTFIAVQVLSIGLQAFLIEVGGIFVGTNGLTGTQWGITLLLGVGSWIVGFISRFIPVEEDPADFFDASEEWRSYTGKQ